MIGRALHRAVGTIARGHGTPIWERDWDICCILDGCRLDVFREHYPDATGVWSVASTSPTWITRTFFGHDTSDVAYVSGNPFSTRVNHDDVAHLHLEEVKETDHGIETVPPGELTEHAIDCWDFRDELGVEQIVVHYMQPHVPFRSRAEWFEEYHGTEIWGSASWHDIGDEGISLDEWMIAYRDNLRWVLDEGVDPLQEAVDAEIALTADHGNAAGEWGIYGHPRDVVTPQVRRVPWVTVEGDGKHRPVGGAVEPTTDIDREQQLAALGYMREFSTGGESR